MTTEQTTTTAILKLKDVVTNPDGTTLKDGSQENRSQVELQKLTPKQILESYPDFTIGKALIGLISNKKNVKDMMEAAKLERLSAKIRNKMLTDKGEWQVDQQELLDLKEIFDKTDPTTINVNLHGQIYNKLQDLLIKVTA